MQRLLGTLALFALMLAAATSAQAEKFDGMRITEIMRDHKNGAYEYLEITNLGNKPIDPKGMLIYIYEATTTTPDAGSPYTIKGKLLQPGETLALTEDSTPPSGEEAVSGIGWTWSSSGGVILADANKNIVDAVFAGTIKPANISDPGNVGTHWTGGNVGNFTSGAKSFQRTGTADSNTSADWTAAIANTIGTLNAGLEPGGAIEWLGSVDGNWNNPDNWDGGVLPTAEDDVSIAFGTGAMPVLVAGVEIAGLTLEDNASVELAANAQVQIAGDVKIGANAAIAGSGASSLVIGGNLVLSASSLVTTAGFSFHMKGSAAQSVTTNDAKIGNLIIDNPGNTVTIEGAWGPINDGMVTSTLGSIFTFESELLDFSNSSFDNQGDMQLGLTAGGVNQLIQTIVVNGQNLGNVTLFTADAMDEIEFQGDVGFEDLSTSGLGPIRFLDSLLVDGDFEHALDFPLEVNDLSGKGEITLRSAMDFRVLGDMQAASLSVEGNGLVSLGGALDLSAALTMRSSLGMPILDLAGAANFDSLVIESEDPIVLNGGLFVKSVNFAQKGQVTVTGPLQVTNYLALVDGTLSQFAGPSSIEGVSIAGDHILRLNGAATLGEVTVRGSGFLDIVGTATITGSVDIDDLATMRVNDAVTLFSASPVSIEADGAGLEVGRLFISNSAGASLSGEIRLTLGGLVTPALRVNTGTGVTLEAFLEVSFLNAFGPSRVLVDGNLVTQADKASAPALIAPINANNHGVLEVNGGLSAHGLRLTNFGAPSLNYAIDFAAASSFVACRDLWLSGCEASIGAIRLLSNDVPSTIAGLHLDGSSNTSINADALNGLTVRVEADQASAGNLYRANDEQDANNVLIWDTPAVLAILNGTNIPNALAEQAYTFDIDAEGGNDPLVWTLANAPSWLSINSETGELTGTPAREDVGSKTFAVLVSDASSPSNVASQIVSITVNALTNVAITIPTTELLRGRVGDTYGFALTALGGEGGPYTWTLLGGEFPSGLVLQSSGVIQGIPVEGSAGAYQIQLQAKDASGNAGVKVFDLVIDNDILAEGQSPSDILNDGAGGGAGGCALGKGSESSILVLLLIVMSAMVVGRRRRA